MGNKITSTLKQKIAVKKLSEILGSVKNQKQITMGRILREAGYSLSVSKTPNLVTKTKGWKMLMKKFISDEVVMKAHKDLLHSCQLDHYVFPRSEEDKIIKEIVEDIPGCKLLKISKSQQSKRAYFWIPDNRSRSKAIDMVYKLKGRYKKDGEGTKVSILNNPAFLARYSRG